MTSTTDDLPAADPSALEHTLPLLGILIGFGALVMAFASVTVDRGATTVLDTTPYSERTHVLSRTHMRVTYWLEHGYFASCGLMVSESTKGPALYGSSTGAPLISGFVVEKIWSAITGHPSWRLLALHNRLVLLLTAALFALLAFRLARRLGLRPLHALAAAMALEAVWYTFPDNLMTIFEMTGRTWWLAGACVFLLIEERRAEPSRTSTVAMALVAFFATYAEYIAGTAFLLSYAVITIIAGKERPALKRLIVTCLLPIVLAIGIHRTQIACARAFHPRVEIDGNGFFFRTGLDGSPMYYGDHLDIAYGRNVARANYKPEAIRPLLFRWQWLFFASAAATLFILISAMRGRVPRIAIVSLLSLLGAYLIYAAVFSQAVVIHPYYYDMMLFTPLMLALFVLTPSLIESVTREKGVTVIVAIFLAIWVSMVQLRKYAITFPPTLEVPANSAK
jgi:hypothetical protein